MTNTMLGRFVISRNYSYGTHSKQPSDIYAGKQGELIGGPMKNHRPAVFLDRDGTIIEDRGDLSQPAQVVIFKDTIPALRRLAEHFPLFIVTNQSGVAKGTITTEDVERVNGHVERFVAAEGAPITATYVCPHLRSSGCRCIKPNPYFLKEAQREFGIDLRRSFVIGDHPHDVELATRVDATGIYVLSGHGIKHRADLTVRAIIADGIREASEWIIARTSGQNSEGHETSGQAR